VARATGRRRGISVLHGAHSKDENTLEKWGAQLEFKAWNKEVSSGRWLQDNAGFAQLSNETMEELRNTEP
jgi:hypothetical protein